MPVIISNNIALTSEIYNTYNKAVIGWRNLVTRGNITASSADDNYPVSNLANTSTAAPWRAAAGGVQTLTATVGSTVVGQEGGQFIDYVGIARHNLTGSTINVDVDGVVVFTETMIANNDPLILRFDTVAASVVTITITPPVGVVPSIGVMYVGPLTVMVPCILQDVVTPNNAIDLDVVTGNAESGDFLGRIVLSRTSNTSIPFSTTDKAWYDTEIRPFATAAEIIPFFFAWLPDEFPDEVSFSWLSSAIRPSAFRHAPNRLVYNFEISIGSLVA